LQVHLVGGTLGSPVCILVKCCHTYDSGLEFRLPVIAISELSPALLLGVGPVGKALLDTDGGSLVSGVDIYKKEKQETTY
jgi:hypothetical protein